MIQTLKLFRIGFRQTLNDGMMIILLPAPLLIGLLVKCGIPFINILTIQYFDFSLAQWYGVIDGVMFALIPLMISMISAFLLLDERDEGTGAYYQITPVQGYAYLLARIGLPMMWALLCNIVIGLLFHISNLDFIAIFFAGLIGTGAGIACSMMVIALAENRVEGLAISKLMGVSLLGVLAVWFVPSPYQYLAAILPSFWIGVIIQQGMNVVAGIAGTVVCSVWVFLFTKKFLKRI